MSNYIKERFISFLERKTPEIISGYIPAKEHVLVDIFTIEPEKKSTLAMPDSTTKTDLGFEWTTVAKVVAESDCGFVPGDIVKLSDFKVSTFSGSDYEQWISLSEKGTVRRIGAAPPKKMSKFFETFMRFVFNPYPIIRKENDLNLFCIPKHEIIAKIKNPHDLINF